MSNVTFSLKTKIALVLTVLFWSSAFVGIRVSLEGYTPGALALFRFLIASVCMGFIYWRLPKKAVFKRKDFWLLLLFGAVGLGCYNVFLNYGELTVSAGVASFIVSQSPLISMLCAAFFLKEGFNFAALFGVFISIFGVGLITLGHSDNAGLGMGLLFVFMATVVNALYSVIQKPFLNKYHAIDVTVFIIWSGTAALLIYLPDLIHEIPKASLKATLSTIYLGIFPAAIAYAAWSYALSEIPVSRCVSFMYFMPVIATFLGWLCLGEVPTTISLIGGLVALVGVWVANRAYMKGG
jgi:drug/metabolite transporter (DMT)-like permease